jgi:O-antigen ligase
MEIKRKQLLIFSSVLVGIFLLASAYFGFSLELTLLGLAGMAVVPYLVVRFPEWFLVGALFVPQWKTLLGSGSAGGSGDPTVIMRICLAVGLLWRTLMWFGRVGYSELRGLFSRQLFQISAFVFFAAILSVSYTYTNAPDYGGTKLSRFLLIGGLLFISPFFVLLTESDFLTFSRIFVGAGTITAVTLVASLGMRNRESEGDITRIGAGWLVGMALLLLIFYPLSHNPRRQRVLLICLLPVLVGGSMAAAARGPILCLVLCVFLGMAHLIRIGKLRSSTAVAIVLFLIVGVGAAYVVLKQFDAEKFNAKATELETMASGGSSSGSAAKRLDFYRTTLAAIPNQPIFGTGIGSWGVFYFGSDARGYPHNILLEITYEEGIVGLAAFLILLFAMGVALVRMIKASHSHFLVVGLLVLYCVLVSLFSGDLDDNRVMWLWMGVGLSVCRIVQTRISSYRQIQWEMQRQQAAMPSRSFPSPAYSRQFATPVPDRYPVQKKDRAWREKFVS